MILRDSYGGSSQECLRVTKEQELQQLILAVAGEVDVWTDQASWTPEPGSEAAHECANNEQRVDGTAWGEGPVRTVFARAQMAMKATIEHARAMATLIDPNRPALTQEALTRAALESSSVGWWLLEPGLGARRRVARMQLLRRNSAREYERTLDAISEDVTTAGGETIQVVEDYSVGLGLAAFTDKGKECEGEKRRSYTERAKLLTNQFGLEGAYEIYSSVAHGELAGLWRLFPNSMTASSGGAIWPSCSV